MNEFDSLLDGFVGDVKSAVRRLEEAALRANMKQVRPLIIVVTPSEKTYEETVPATEKQQLFLEDRGEWQSGMSKREAWILINYISRQKEKISSRDYRVIQGSA